MLLAPFHIRQPVAHVPENPVSVKRAVKVIPPLVITESLTKEGQENLWMIEQEMQSALPSDATAKQGEVMYGLKSYSPSRHPVLNPNDASRENPLHVRFLVGSEVMSASRFLVEGVERSPYLKLISVSRYDGWKFTMWNTNKVDSNRPVVWMADVQSMGLNCRVLQGLVKHVQLNSNETLPLAFVMMDYSGSAERLHCSGIENLIPRTRIRLARSNIVQHRYWNPSESWIDVGELSPNDGNLLSGGPILFQPYVVRESFVSSLSNALQSENWTSYDDRQGRSPVFIKREKDLAHLWKNSDYSHYSFLRRQVGTIVASLSGRRTRVA